MNNNEPQTTIECGVAHPGFPCNHVFFPEEPDFGVWGRAVDRAVEALDLDWYPSEEAVAELVAELGLTDPDEGDQMQTLEDELIALYSE